MSRLVWKNENPKYANRVAALGHTRFSTTLAAATATVFLKMPHLRFVSTLK
jgi:hypothetical protein